MSRFSIDWLLGGVGVGMATASASFAAYMVATAPAQVVGFGSKEFRVFAAYDRRTSGKAAGRAPMTMAFAAPPAGATPTPAGKGAPPPPPQQSTGSPGVSLASAGPSNIDPEPTGSVPPGASGRSLAARSPDRSLRVDPAALADFHVREVVSGRAIIEHGGKVSLVAPGTVLAGAGEVLSIERRIDGWVVTTTAGIIRGT